MYKGRGCGTIGDAGCFSFYPGKNLGACGDAGAITAGSDALASRLRRLRNYGQEVKYVHVEQGLSSRLAALQAAILSLKPRHVVEWNRARYTHAQEYRQRLAAVGDLEFQAEAPYSTHIYHLFMISTSRREGLRAHLSDRGIETVIHYPIPIHLQQAYASLGYR